MFICLLQKFLLLGTQRSGRNSDHFSSCDTQRIYCVNLHFSVASMIDFYFWLLVQKNPSWSTNLVNALWCARLPWAGGRVLFSDSATGRPSPLSLNSRCSREWASSSRTSQKSGIPLATLPRSEPTLASREFSSLLLRPSWSCRSRGREAVIRDAFPKIFFFLNKKFLQKLTDFTPSFSILLTKVCSMSGLIAFLMLLFRFRTLEVTIFLSGAGSGFHSLGFFSEKQLESV